NWRRPCARPCVSVEPRQYDLGFQRGHVSLPLESVGAGGLGGLWPLGRYNRRKRTHAGPALCASLATTSAAHDGGPANPPRPPGEEDDGHQSRNALAVGAPFIAALF